MESSWVICLFAILTCGVVQGQRTYQRACECEYMVNGRCAYTLLLPAGSQGGGNEQSCPTGSKGAGIDDEELDMLKLQVESLIENVTNLVSWGGEQTRMITQVQSLLLEQQSAMSAITTKFAALENATFGNFSFLNAPIGNFSFENSAFGNRNQTDMGLESVMESTMELFHEQLNPLLQSLESQGQALNTLQEHLMEQMSGQAALFGNITIFHETIDGIMEKQEMIMNFTERLSKVEMAVEKLQEERMTKPAPNSYMLCMQRGLLISDRPDNVYNITASSTFNEEHGPERAGIKTEVDGEQKGAWCPRNNTAEDEEGEPNAEEEWLQFNLGGLEAVYGIVTRGRSDYAQWVEKFRMRYSNGSYITTETGEELVFEDYMDPVGLPQVFDGNSDQSTPKINMLWQPIRAQYIRIIPLVGYEGRNKCMRADVIGCLEVS